MQEEVGFTCFSIIVLPARFKVALRRDELFQ